MATGDVWKVIFNFQWGSVGCRPGFYLVEGTGGAHVDPQAEVADAVAVALSTTPLAGFSDQLTLDALTIVDIQPGTLPTTTYTKGPYTGDEVDANPLPPQSAAVISEHTLIKGSVGVYAAAGRMYLPGCPQTGQISGFLTAGFQTALTDFAALLGNTFITDGTAYQWHVVSLTPNVKPATVRALNPVTSLTINNVVRSQRRREFGVGQ